MVGWIKDEWWLDQRLGWKNWCMKINRWENGWWLTDGSQINWRRRKRVWEMDRSYCWIGSKNLQKIQSIFVIIPHLCKSGIYSPYFWRLKLNPVKYILSGICLHVICEAGYLLRAPFPLLVVTLAAVLLALLTGFVVPWDLSLTRSEQHRVA